MENVYYIYEPEYEKLIVMTTQIGMITDEEQLKIAAEDSGMRWAKCSWGIVRHFEACLN
jgi:hypothetical protein